MTRIGCLLCRYFPLLPLLLAGIPIAAAQTEETIEARVPDPVALTADWWLYFQSADDALEERVAALQVKFDALVAGLIILFEKSLKVGDFVELESGLTGEVREINIRATLITTNDNIDILVPNSEFVSGRVTNWTLREAHRRVRIPFGVAYGTDKEQVRLAVLEAADTVPYTLTSVKDREPQVWLVGFGDSSLNFEFVAWLTQDAVKRPGRVQAAYTWAIETALSRHGIEIPFPQQDLHIRSYFGHKDADGLRVVSELAGRVHHPAAVQCS